MAEPRRGASAGTGRGAVVWLVLAVLVTAGLLSAAAPPARLLLSSDGSSFAARLPGPILADLGPMVPGDRVEDRFWARNATDEPATLILDLTDVEVSTPPAAPEPDQFWLTVTAGSMSVRTPLRADAECQRIETVGLDPAADQLVRVAVDLPAAAGNLAQERELRAELNLSLQPAGAPVQGCPPGGVAAPAPPDLPRTGAELLVLLLAAMALLITGAALRGRTR